MWGWVIPKGRPPPHPGHRLAKTESSQAAATNKPITGRPPQILPIYEPEFMKNWRDMKAADLARFIALARGTLTRALW